MKFLTIALAFGVTRTRRTLTKDWTSKIKYTRGISAGYTYFVCCLVRLEK